MSFNKNTCYKAKCFLCNENIRKSENFSLLFRTDLFKTLSTVLGVDINENNVHSKVLCESCHNIILEYESVEKQFSKLRQQILYIYNCTAQLYDFKTSALESNFNITKKYTYEDLIIKDDNLSALIEEVSEEEDEDNVEFNRNDYEIEGALGFNEISNEELQNAEEVDGIIFALPAVEIQLEDNDDLHLPTVHMDHNEQNAVEVETHNIVAYGKVIEENVQNDECSDNGGNDVIYAIDNSTSSTAQHINIVETNKAEILQDPTFIQKGDSYQCITCSSLLLDAESFAQHLRDMHKAHIIFCEYCQITFLSEQQLQQHMEIEHQTSICLNSQNYDNQQNEEIQNAGISKSYQCQQCDKKYTSKNLLDLHLNVHSGEKPFKCTQCSKEFASKYTLATHLKIHSERSRFHKCNLCDKTFLNLQNLSNHQKLHEAEKLFGCEECGKAFATKHNLDVHKIIHSGVRPFTCSTCGKSFARKADLKDHERIHTKEKPFKCDICESSFSQRSNLMTHRKSTHFNEKQHQCQLCDKSFKRRRLLDYHVQAIHTGERPFKCDLCPASFVYPEHFKKHTLIHSGKKPYSCEFCGKQFTSRDNRNAHRYVHSDKKPYECSECGAGYMRKPLLYAHMKQTGHGSNTIIINQPQILGTQIKNIEESYNDVVVDNLNEYVIDSNNSNEVPATIMQPDVSYKNNLRNNVSNSNTSGGEQVIYKYMELDDFDNGSLAWVDDIHENKD